jgi:signal transduction histidine kinase
MQINVTLIFFVYGLAFFSMGVVMLLESGRSPILADALALLPLALFGFIHGIHEWFEMALMDQTILDIQLPIPINWSRISILAISFIFLFIFSLRVLRPEMTRSSLETIILITIVLVFAGIIIISTIFSQNSHADWFSHVDALTRYFLAVPAACLAGLAFFRKGAAAREATQNRQRNVLWLVAFGFIGYGLTQTFVPATDSFPSNIWNSATFLEITGFPIQVIRALLAVIITVGLLRVSQLNATERQKQLIQSEKARLEALERVRTELESKENLRRELLRRTVIAQEEERTRVARELHDETSQLLAAISLQLESLRNVSHTTEINKQIDELQVLRRRISEGIYRLMHDLRPAQLDDIGLTAALSSLVDDSRKHMGLTVDLQVKGQEKRLDPFVETVLFRVAQEALTNVARHAGVTQAFIMVLYSPERVELIVKDEGRGFSANGHPFPHHGWGLAGMNERVEAAGGNFHLKSSPGNGTIITVIVPKDKIIILQNREERIDEEQVTSNSSNKR